MAKVRILVVEDEFIIAQNISRTLEDIGYEISGHAFDYEEALEEIRDHPPDLVLLDIILRGEKDGIDVAAVLHEEHSIPFIFLTSHSDVATVKRAKEVKPYAYIVKPFKKQDLFAAIEIALSNFEAGKFAEHSENPLSDPLPGEESKGGFGFNGVLFVKDGRQYLKLHLEEIAYLRSDHVYIEIHLTNFKKYVIRDSLNHYMDKLGEQFYRAGRSYIINKFHIEKLDSRSVRIRGEDIPLTRPYRDALKKMISGLA